MLGRSWVDQNRRGCMASVVRLGLHGRRCSGGWIAMGIDKTDLARRGDACGSRGLLYQLPRPANQHREPLVVALDPISMDGGAAEVLRWRVGAPRTRLNVAKLWESLAFPDGIHVRRIGLGKPMTTLGLELRCGSGGARKGDEARWRRLLGSRGHVEAWRRLYRGAQVPLAWRARLGRRRQRWGHVGHGRPTPRPGWALAGLGWAGAVWIRSGPRAQPGRKGKFYFSVIIFQCKTNSRKTQKMFKGTKNT
jgi:hypothetical protein